MAQAKAQKRALFNKSSIVSQAEGAATMDRRTFNLIIGGLLVFGFGVLALSSWLALQPTMQAFIGRNELAIGVGSLVLSIGGMILIGVGTSKKSVGLMLTGYIVFTLAFGATSSIWLPRYGIDTITNALATTAGISLVFTALGAMFPDIFKKLMPVAMVTLLVVLAASVVMMFFGGSPTWIDYVTVAVFSIFIAYDTHQAAIIEPNMFNAIMAATSIFLDIVNIFLALLDIFDNR